MKMEKKVTPTGLVTKSAAQKVSAYNWKSQGTDTVKFGTGGQTTNGGGLTPLTFDSWTD